jgi:hypothetical protein
MYFNCLNEMGQYKKNSAFEMSRLEAAIRNRPPAARYATYRYPALALTHVSVFFIFDRECEV